MPTLINESKVKEISEEIARHVKELGIGADFLQSQENLMPEINPKNWFYCLECDSISYHFDCCGNSACSGGGCPTCHDFHAHIISIMDYIDIRLRSKGLKCAIVGDKMELVPMWEREQQIALSEAALEIIQEIKDNFYVSKSN